MWRSETAPAGRPVGRAAVALSGVRSGGTTVYDWDDESHSTEALCRSLDFVFGKRNFDVGRD